MQQCFKFICQICNFINVSQLLAVNGTNVHTIHKIYILYRKATERVYAGGKDTERVEDGPDSADMEEERGCA